ncbi:hypothetical protein NE237_007288 [Protea cynaroides]|uniref:Uncharacterized protein n=1 Tax=Protea cynaroides TaxID=273540 RepID=A0A9Q0QWD1_9MAGN|nr:hypothetical protein NE237_007288 [Protea cynaroides]
MEALEIPVINRISSFEAGLNRLHNPSFVSRVTNLLSIEEIFLNYSLWTWGALILAVVATFSSLVNRSKLVIFRFCRQQRPVGSEHFLRPLIHEDEHDSCSSSDEDELPTSPFENQRPFDEDFRVAGSGDYDEDQGQKLKFRSPFSWSDFASGKSVVKLWDGLGLGLKIQGSSTESIVSMWDFNKDEIISSFCGGGWCQIPAISRTAPPVILMGGVEESRNAALRVWDARVGRQIPAVFAEFGTSGRRIVGVDSGGVEKVYITDSGSVTLRDMRKIGFAMESDGETCLGLL